MGHHINAIGQFQSDKFPEIGVDNIVLSFKDVHARSALALYAQRTDDRELGADIKQRLDWPNIDQLIHEEMLAILKKYGV